MESMPHRRVVVATSVLTLLACVAVVFAFVTSRDGHRDGYEEQPAVSQGIPENVEQAIPLAVVSETGLQQSGALEPISPEIEVADLSAADYPLVALTDALELDPSVPYVVGVTWRGPEPIAIDARYMTEGKWRPWERVDIDGWDPGEGDPDVQGTEPYLAVNTTAVQFRASSQSGVPPELTVWIFSSELVPVSESSGTSAVGSGVAVSPDTRYAAMTILSNDAAVSPVSNPQPVIHLREEWFPRDPSGEFDIGTVQGAVIHHTAGTNYYSEADVPAILRAIQNYHMDVRGWFDTGYNFLVDRFGRIWEGRAGGIENTIWGVHSHSFNGIATGVSVMGNFDLVQPPAAAVNSLVDLIAWKLTLHGVSAKGSMYNYLSGYFPAIITHRDVPEASTTCPGKYLYAGLADIRRAVVAKQNLPSLELNVDVTGDGLGNVVRLQDGVVSVYTPGTVWLGSDTVYLPGLGTFPFDSLTEGPALSGVGTDTLAFETNTGRLYRLPSGGDAQLIAVMQPSGGAGSTVVLLSGDVTGDGHGDLVSVDMRLGSLKVWPGNGAGGVAPPISILSGWGAVAAVTAPGDINGDGNPDLLTILADGKLRVANGDGSGGFTLGTALLGDWHDFTHLVGVDDRTGDGIPDLVAWSHTTGEARTIVGGVSGPTGVFETWAEPQSTRPPEFGSTEWASEVGFLPTYSKPHTKYWAYDGITYPKDTLIPTGLSLDAPDAVSTAIVGDVDGNGFADLVTVDTSGRLWLHLSEGTNFGDPVEIANPDDEFSDWAGYSSIAGAGDINFDGRPDLAAIEADGDVVVFPWSTTDPAELQFVRVIARGYVGYEAFGTGSWGPNRVSDLMVVGPTGDVILLQGNGLTGATTVGTISTGWDASTEFWGLGVSERGQAAGVVVYLPETDAFTYYTWSTTSEWTLAANATDGTA